MFLAKNGSVKASPTHDTAKKEELLPLLEGVEPEVHKLETLGQEIVQVARFTRDVAGPLNELVKVVPEGRLPVDDWNRQVEGWRSWHDTARHLQAVQTTVNSFGALSEGVINTSVSGVIPVFYGKPPSLPAPPAVEQARATLFQTLDRYPLADQAIASMRRLRLDSRGGGSRTPIDLLRKAVSAIERPVVGGGGPVSVLIALRECIDAVITELVRRRPKQEPVKGWSGKVASVGSQCGRPLLLADDFSRLGVDTEALMNQFSSAKQADMDRGRRVRVVESRSEGRENGESGGSAGQLIGKA